MTLLSKIGERNTAGIIQNTEHHENNRERKQGAPCASQSAENMISAVTPIKRARMTQTATLVRTDDSIPAKQRLPAGPEKPEQLNAAFEFVMRFPCLARGIAASPDILCKHVLCVFIVVAMRTRYHHGIRKNRPVIVVFFACHFLRCRVQRVDLYP
jgi:hypothetical protein